MTLRSRGSGGGGGGASTNHRTPTNILEGSNMPSTVLLLSVAMFGFFSGTLLTLHSGLGNCDGNILATNALFGGYYTNNNNNNDIDAQVEQLALQRIQELQKALPKCTPDKDNNNNKQIDDNNNNKKGPIKLPVTMQRWATGMARTNKMDFSKVLDTGVPLDLPQGQDSDVLIVFGNEKTLPDDYDSQSSQVPTYPPEKALQHCDFVNIILTNHDQKRNQCLAIMPQYESYHIHKWMRLADHPSKGNYGGIDTKAPLVPVSRGMPPNGHGQFFPPHTSDIQNNWNMLSKYFASYTQSLSELKPLAEKVATKTGNTVTVMVSNFGQSELLVNFVCAAKSRNLDISSILVFATDMETKELAEALGLTAFYDERNFGEMPSEAAHHYGDKKFTAMMMAKVICVQMISALKYNILFQDVDIVWYKDPIAYFENNWKDFDMLFQDDGGHTVRYAPYSANSGFYYVRYNARTEYFFSSLLLAGDLILKTDSHQQALIALMGEHVSLYGMRVKVFSRDEEDFPGGYHFHQKTGKYLRAFYRGEVHPYIFHMSWTKNKDNKLLFFQQMGDWYVNEQCIHKQVSEVDLSMEGGGDYVSTCCSAEAIVKCHYRDKPSKFPCKDSPPIDDGKPSWWK